jgi:dihydropyrimidinase
MNVLWSKLVSTGIISPEKYVSSTSTEAAKIFNIFPKKGIRILIFRSYFGWIW